MRKLPVYFLIDVSESMTGEPIKEVEKGIQSMVHFLRSDPYALETAFLSVLIFAGNAKILVPLTELIQFHPPVFPVGSGTNLAEGLELLMKCLDTEVNKTSQTKKGDWKPIIFLFTDGAPTTNTSSAAEKWRRNYRDHTSFISIIFGEHADVKLLESLGQETFVLKDLSPESFREFFKWVSASLQVSSMAIADTGKDGIHLASGNINLEKASPSQSIDENFAILSMKCAKNHKLSLIKYDATQNPHKLIGAYLVDEDEYNNLSINDGFDQKISTDNLDDYPDCPGCGSSGGFIHCGKCGKLGCAMDSDFYTCPWCGNSGRVEICDNLTMGRNRG